MKKINILLSGLFLCSMAFTACDNDQELPPITYPAGGSAETVHSGLWNDPYSIWQVLAGVENDAAWTTGYIVGYINTFDGDYAKLREKSAVFSATGAPNSNLLLADSPDETDWQKCIPVQLEYGTAGRDLSLGYHPEYLHRQVTIFGLTGDKYLSVYGVRFCSAYNWGSEGVYVPTPGDGVKTFLTDGQGECTIENVLPVPAGLNFVWEWSSQYKCAKATGYLNNTSYNTDSYLVTPEIKLGDNPSGSVDQALNYLRGGVLSQNVGIYIREGVDGDWVELPYKNEPTGTSFDFVTSEFDLSDYAGKAVQIGLRYRSTTSLATTWEVKNLYIF